MTEILYPSVENVVEINRKVLLEIKVRKADRSALMSLGRKILDSIIKDTKDEEGIFSIKLSYY